MVCMVQTPLPLGCMMKCMGAYQVQSFSQSHGLCGDAQSTEGMPFADWHKLALCLVSLSLLETKYEIQWDVAHKTQ